MTLDQKRLAIDCRHQKISVLRQCELLGMARSSLYYKPCRDTTYNEQLMRLLDEQYIETPFYGVDKMTHWLRRSGHQVNPKRIRSLLRKMGLESIYPRRKLNLSKPDKAHKIYPYLLRNTTISRINQVWSTDITYIRMHQGWVYLVAVMDWHRRYILSWELSITLEADFCVMALENALKRGTPVIFNTDQGSQFTSGDFTDPLLKAGISISMDGRGRCFDNIFIERLWRTVKVEEVYIKDYQTVAEASLGLGRYIEFYNNERFHKNLGLCTPAEVFREGVAPPVALRAPSVAKPSQCVMSASKKKVISV